MHLRRFLFVLFACCALGPPLLAPPLVAQSTAKTFTLTGANQCASTGTSGLPTVGIAVSGTFSLTLQPQVALGGSPPSNSQVTPSNSTTPQSTVTAAGVYSAGVGGYDYFQLCVSSYTSGTVTVVLNPSPALNARALGGSGGGTVAEVDTGWGLNGGPINTTGTIALDTTLPNGEQAVTQPTGDTSADVSTDAFVAAALSASGLLPQSGCGVEAIAGTLNVTVGACINYTINQEQYSSPLTTVTLATADPTNPRLDLIGVDNTGSVFVTTGTPAVNPVEPSADPSTQFGLTAVLVPAGATSPSLTVVDIYHNCGPWTITNSGSPITTCSTANPYNGANPTSVNGNAATTGNYVQFTVPASGTYTLSNYNNVVLYVDPSAAWPATRSLTFQAYSGATAVGSPVLLGASGTFGFNSAMNSYQQVAIPASLFGTGSATATSLRITVSGSGATISFDLADVTLQGGAASGSGAVFMNNRGAWNSTASYNAQNVVTYLGTSWIAVAANSNSAPTLTNPNWQAQFNCGTNQQVLFNNNGTCAGDSGFLYNPITHAATLTGPLTASQLNTVGPGPGAWFATEGSAPSGVVGQDIVYADSGAHCFKMILNNGAVTGCIGSSSGTVTSIATTSPIAGGTITTSGTISCPTCAIGPGSSTANHLAKFSGTDGLTLADGGAIPAGTVTSVTGTSPVASSGGTTPAISINNNGITAAQLAAQYSKGQCTEVWGGSGTSNAMQSGDDAIVNNACYNDSGVTRTITAVKCRSDNAANTTVLTPTFGSAGTGTAILTGTVTCGNSYAYSATGTLNNTSWTTGTGIDPGMSTVGNATSIAMIVEFTY